MRVVPDVDALSLAGRILHDAQPAAGGFSGETFAGLWMRQRAYVRLYLRDPARAEVDLALLRLLNGRIPLPKVLRADTEAPTSARSLPAHIVTAAVPGQRADVLLEMGTSAPAARALGRQSARIVGALRQQGFDTAGPLSGRDLRVGQFPAEYAGLTSVARRLTPGLSAAGLDVTDHSPLGIALAAADARLSGAPPQRPCLVHSDLNGKNLIVDPDSGRLRAVLDWEFAHAGNWLADIGNLLRGTGRAPTGSPVARAFREGLVDEMHESLLADRRSRWTVPPDWVRSAHDHDLFALLELAARPVTDAAAPTPRRPGS